MKSVLKSILSYLLVGIILLSSTSAALTAKAVGEDPVQFEAEYASPLIVTEVVPTGPTTGRYTYTEIYNNSDSPINFKDYTFYYWYPTSLGKTWTTNGTDVIIQPGKTLVLWQNDGTLGTTLADFNAYYGVNLVNNVDIYQINYSGIHATAKRGFLFGRDADNIIAEAWCNETAADVPSTQRNNKLGVQYTYPRSGTVSTKQEVSKATPGSVADWQVPATKVHYDSGNPKIVSTSGAAAVPASQPLTATATIDGMVGGMNVYLYYKQAEDLEYRKVKMQRTPGTKDFTATLDRTLLWGDNITWYVGATYGAGLDATSSVTTTPVQYTPIDDSKKAPLVVTEIVTPPGTGMQYSYIEIYNRTNKAVNYGFYNLYYQYPDLTYLTWTISQPDIMIEPGKALVLWLNTNGMSIDGFNTYYHSNLQENKDIVRIDYAGLHQTAQRTVYIGKTFDTPIVTASFNDSGADLVAGSGNSIKYTYPRTEDNKCIKVSTNTPADPGAVEAWQVPTDSIPFRGYEGYSADDGSSPSVVLADTIKPINEGDELFVTFNIADTMGLTGMAINYRLDGQGAFTRVCEAKQRVLTKFFARIPSDVLFGHDYVEFYVEGFNLFRKTTTETYRVNINRINDTKGVRLSVNNSSVLSGTKTITANAGNNNSSTQLFVDGEQVVTKPVLEDGAYFAVTCDGLNSYFKNALTAPYGGNPREVLSFFAPWASLNSRVVRVDNKYFTQNADGSYDITLSMWAGDSGTPFEDIYIPTENHEDYTVTNLQLRLANGKTYLPTAIGPVNEKSNTSTAYDAIHTIGDSTGMSPRLDISFHIPAEEVTAVGYVLNTTSLADGAHTVKAVSGGTENTVQIVVDNTKPEINMGIAEDSVVKNQLAINPEITDSSKISQSSVTLDGEEITVPYTNAARNLAVGEHELVATATDAAGNTSQKIVHFKTMAVDPNVSGSGNNDITTASAKLSVNISDLNANKATVEFMQGKQLTVKDGEISVKNGHGDSPLSDTDSASAGDIPYQLYTINASAADDSDTITASWSGTANYADANHAIKMYVLNRVTNTWEEVGTADAQGKIDASFLAKDHLQDGRAQLLVQCLAQASSPKTTVNTSSAVNTAASEWDGTNRPANYDFSFAWITDTQYYTETWPNHFTQQNQWIVDNANDWKIKYTIHTGDLIDEYDLNDEWLRADNAMKIFDNAGMPYGVLGGNHDVAAGNQLYRNYWKYFGEQRFEGKPWYGGSYNNNLGHYDLLTENGQDMIILYMSWDIYQNEINWMNQVLAQYADRKAIICLHRYTNVKMTNDSYLDYAGKVLQQNVVAKNPNVVAVLNGHYHGSAIETTGFDDNKDGINDRQVYQICTDYQSDVEGGSEYIKFLYFDLSNNKIYMNSYSPYRQDFNYFDTPKLATYAAGTKANNMDIFDLDVNFDTSEKTLTAQSFSSQILSDTVIGKVDNVTDKAEYVWNGLSPSTTYGWYAKVTNENGGVAMTQVQELTTDPEHKITASAGAGGSISNVGDTMVADGGDITYTVTPDAGYIVNQVLVDGQPVTLTDGKLTLSNVTTDHTVTVSFKEQPTGPQIPANPITPYNPSVKEVKDSATGSKIDLSGVTLPAAVTGISMQTTLMPASGADAAVYSAVEELMKKNEALDDFSKLLVFDVKLLDQNGQAITKFDGKIKVKIPVPEGMSGNLHVLWYNDQTGTVTDMNAVIEDGYLVFETDHLSFYAVAQLKTDSSTPIAPPNTGDRGAADLVGILLISAMISGSCIAARKRERKKK